MLGANDGILSISSLVLGVAAAHGKPNCMKEVLLTTYYRLSRGTSYSTKNGSFMANADLPNLKWPYQANALIG